MEERRSELVDKIIEVGRKNLLILALGLVGLTLFAYGLISLFLLSKPSDKDIIFEVKEADSGNISNSTKEEKLVNITVDIEGSVVSPGVYRLPLNSRIKDAIVVSGGLSATADRDFIAKNINLAIKLSDGAKIYIPKVGDVTANESVMGKTLILGSVASQIKINSASEQELDALPGIGPVTSQKIISGRPYYSIQELLEKKIVGSKVFEQIKDKITVY